MTPKNIDTSGDHSAAKDHQPDGIVPESPRNFSFRDETGKFQRDSTATGHFSRLDPEITGNLKRGTQGVASKGHRFIEIILFVVFILAVGIAGLALYTAYSPRYKEVPNHVAAGLQQDRVNILLIGIGGDKHIGGGTDLADSIMFVSLKPSTRQVAVTSVPRDLYVKVPKRGSHRLNNAHAIGEQSGFPGGGPGLLIETLEGSFGQPVHAFVRLDFEAFEKIIDNLGGIDIYVQRTFFDFLFKDGFEKGWHHMNGNRALRYARYRYIDGPEGDNFARELRQQQVMNAVKEKLGKRSPTDILRLANTLRTLSKHTDTNLSLDQMIALYKDFHGVERSQVRHVSLKPFMEKFMLRTISDPGEAVRPRGDSYAEVRQLMAGIFSDMKQVGTPDDITLSEPPPAPLPMRPAQPPLSQ